jgi:hypothetical protein
MGNRVPGQVLMEVIAVVDGNGIQPVDVRRGEYAPPTSGARPAERDFDRFASRSTISGLAVFYLQWDEAETDCRASRPALPFDRQQVTG